MVFFQGELSRSQLDRVTLHHSPTPGMVVRPMRGRRAAGHGEQQIIFLHPVGRVSHGFTIHVCGVTWIKRVFGFEGRLTRNL